MFGKRSVGIIVRDKAITRLKYTNHLLAMRLYFAEARVRELEAQIAD